MKKCLILYFVWLSNLLVAQELSGRVHTQGEDGQYLNHVYITNLREMRTGLTDAVGNFRIPARVGDVIRFTSYFHQRKDFIVTEASLLSPVMIDLSLFYRTIPEVVIDFRPTGNLRQDVASLRNRDKYTQQNEHLRQAIGLPEPKTDVNGESLLGLNQGISFNLEALYDILSGQRESKKRLQRFEKMTRAVDYVRKYYTKEYFVQMGIPEHKVDDFLQFVYSSDPYDFVLKDLKPERVRPLIERYLPIYQKRLADMAIQEKALNRK